MTQNDLDDLFTAARGRPVEPSPEFLSRLLVDAYDHLPDPATAPGTPPPRRSLAGALRGWLHDFAGPAAGLACATAAGLWIGFVQPTSLDRVTGALTLASAESTATDETVELIPRLEGWLGEG